MKIKERRRYDEVSRIRIYSCNRRNRNIIETEKMPINNLTAQQRSIIQFVEGEGQITSRQVEELLELKQRRVRGILGELINMGLLERQGSYKSTVYVL